MPCFQLFSGCKNLILAVTLIHLLGFSSTAQNPNETPPKPKFVIADPIEITLRTTDGVNLQCTYLKAALPENEPEVGKRTIPFLLLHDWEGSRRDMLPFALELQQAGCAVIVPDLRGHGESMTSGDTATPIDLKKFRKQDFSNLMMDAEACKKYLIQRNNEGELNIDLLSVVAVGQTCVMAMDWIVRDWYAFPPYKGAIKQGQDVKSVALISPVKKLGPLTNTASLKHPMFSGRSDLIPNLPTVIVWTESDSSPNKETRSIFETMKKGRPDMEKVKDPQIRAELETLFDRVIPNSRQSGTELILQNPGIRNEIMKFVAASVGTKRDSYTWQSRAAKE